MLVLTTNSGPDSRSNPDDGSEIQTAKQPVSVADLGVRYQGRIEASRSSMSDWNVIAARYNQACLIESKSHTLRSTVKGSLAPLPPHSGCHSVTNATNWQLLVQVSIPNWA
jgi:hypothetical protein